jgi:hypothetical protein
MIIKRINRTTTNAKPEFFPDPSEAPMILITST